MADSSSSSSSLAFAATIADLTLRIPNIAAAVADMTLKISEIVAWRHRVNNIPGIGIARINNVPVANLIRFNNIQ